MANYEEIKFGGRTYIQRNEYSTFKYLDENNNFVSIEKSSLYDGQLEEIIKDALTIKYNVNKYFTTKVNFCDEFVVTEFNNIDNLKNIVIPEEIDGRKVVFISDIFKDEKMQRIFFPETLIALSTCCFEGNSYVSEIYLPPSFKKILAETFKGCRNLKKINLENVESIGVNSFASCFNLENINLEKAKIIYPRAFYNCKKIESINAPNLTSLCHEVFCNCKNLKKATISNDIEIINAATFRYCTSLENINTPKKLKEIKGCAFQGCVNLNNFDFTNKIETIQYNAFEDSGLNGQLILPDSVISIEDSAFNNCKFSTISISPKTQYAPLAFGLYNIDKIKIRKKMEKIKNLIER